jgi:hypothetical protein
MAKLTLSDIKARTTGHFFDHKTMKFFSSSSWPGATYRTTYKANYNKVTDSNFVVVCDPWGSLHYYKFDESTGALNPVNDEDVNKVVFSEVI